MESFLEQVMRIERRANWGYGAEALTVWAGMGLVKRGEKAGRWARSASTYLAYYLICPAGIVPKALYAIADIEIPVNDKVWSALILDCRRGRVGTLRL